MHKRPAQDELSHDLAEAEPHRKVTLHQPVDELGRPQPVFDTHESPSTFSPSNYVSLQQELSHALAQLESLAVQSPMAALRIREYQTLAAEQQALIEVLRQQNNCVKPRSLPLNLSFGQKQEGSLAPSSVFDVFQAQRAQLFETFLK